jgi:sugar lactone lactonase YvrE
LTRKFFWYSAIILALLALAAAEGTHTWEQRKFDDLEKGTAKGVAIRSDGGLELAPSFKSLITTPSTYIWSVAADAQGNVYAAAGSPGRVYRITPQGQATIIFQPQELQVQSLLVGRDGVVYAATSPDGKVYKIERNSQPVKAANAPVAAPPGNTEDQTSVPVDSGYKSSVWFDPKSKYIWALAEDAQGRIYVATGDQGKIFRVNPDGTNSLFFKSDEAHIRSLAIDPKGNVIAGSDGSGLVYRISPAGEAFVLYSAPKKEITSLAMDEKGNIFASGVGEKAPRATGGTNASTFSMPASTSSITIGGASVSQGASIPMTPFPASGATGGSEIYRIAPDGSPERLWSSRDDVVYALTLDSQGRLLAATGNHGKIYVVTGPGQFTDLVQASANQVTALAKSPSGGVYAATSNLGKVFLLGGTPEAQGDYESDVFDARIFSRWGRVEVRGQGAFDLFARSGNVDNPDRNWSPWSKVDLATGGELNVPPARFVQWKAVLKPGTPAPVIDSVLVNYLPKNVAPEISDFTVQPGARFNPIPKPPVENVTVAAANAPPIAKFEAPVPAVKDKNSIALRWTANDENDDDLLYSVYYRGDNETRWKLLKGGLDDSYYSFDASLLPDGGYVFKVVASDAPSHSPQDALSSSHISDRVEVDTTPPQVQNLNAAVDNDALHITFRAVDGFSVIKRSEYSIDAGPWQYVEPVGGLSDYRVENYDFSAPLPQATSSPASAAATGTSHEHVVVVRSYDRFDNMGSSKFVVH